MAMPAPLSREEISTPTCPNCGSATVRRYCADCGQALPAPDDYSLRAHAADVVDQIATVDGKAVRTVWALVARPGLLTVEHLRGRRARWLKPLQLFLLVNVLLFVVAPRVPMFSYRLEAYRRFAPPSPSVVTRLVDRAAPPSDADAVERYAAAFDARVEAQRKSLILLFAPAFALVLRAMLAVRPAAPGVPRRYGEHLVFSLHALAFVWLALAGTYGLITTAMPALDRFGRSVVSLTAIALLLATPIYLFVAVRRVYAMRPLPALVVTAALAGAFLLLLVGYRGLLFFTTYYTL